jgi:signal transduction histidine kinase
MRSRERWLPALTIVVMALLMGLIVRTVFDAQNRARRALEDNQNTAITQFAASMDARIGATLGSVSGLVSPSFTLDVGNPADQALLQQVQSLIPDARTGIVLLNADRVVVNGTLLRDPTIVGKPYDRPGLAKILTGGKPAVLPVDAGLTTTLPTIAIAFPIPGPGGAPRGIYVFESDVSPESDLSQEITALGNAGGEYTFIDNTGKVVVSNNPDRLGKQLPHPEYGEGKSGFRRADGLVIASADVKSAGWRLVFTQNADKFEAGLGRRVAQATTLIAFGSLLFGALLIVTLARRLRAEQAERRRAEEMTAAREEFISIVSHELRTPVAGVLGFLQSALDHWDQLDDQARRHAAERACANAQRLQALTRDVLDSGAVDAGGLSYSWDIVDLRREVESAVTAAHDLRPDRTVLFDPGEGPAWVRADPDRIQQVLVNLLDNAAANGPPDTDIEVSLHAGGDEVEVSVVDHGPGLSEGDLERVFEKFVRGRSTVRGTGLGLYLAREIMNAHHGRIWADRAGTAGARFCFSLPLVSAPSAPAESLS